MKKPKILMVDEEPLEFIKEILSKDYEFILASGGIDALIEADRALPDLVVLNAMMPNMNGYAVCRELKADDKTSSIPVMMITGQAGNEDRMRAIESGADCFMDKTTGIRRLNAKIKSLIKTAYC